MRFPSTALLLALALMSPPSASAWGDLGHQVICEIAYQELGAGPVRQKLEALLRAPEAPHALFSRACSWADEVKPKRRLDHFVNLPRSATRVEVGGCPDDEPCLLDALVSDYAALASRKGRLRDRLEALMFLGHFVGDVHQPLHVSFQDDHGGNDILEHGPCFSQPRGGAPREEVSLHFVWDVCIIEKKLGRNPRSIAERLRSEIGDTQRRRWTTGSDPGSRESVKGWADESFQIARDPTLEYCFQRGDTCRYSADRLSFVRGSSPRRVEVDHGYLDRQARIVSLRLQKAGVRLAAWLGAALQEPDEEASPGSDVSAPRPR